MSSRSWSTAPARARRRLVRDGAAQPEHGRRAGTARSTTASRGCRISPRSASTCSISRRSTRSASTNRKGNNNSLKAGARTIPAAPMPSATSQGGHDAVHPELGTLDDFRRLVAACASHDMEIALDFAVQCSPDHPWLQAASGMVPATGRTARSNTPKTRRRNTRTSSIRISPATDRVALWKALRDVMLFWVEQGVRIFRVDNPHTKPLPFWEWLIREVQQPPPRRDLPGGSVHPAEADEGARQARLHPVLHLLHLADRQGRDCRNICSETHRLSGARLSSGRISSSTRRTSCRSICRRGEPWMFKSRAALAATLSSNYGIYNGFELLEHEPIPGKEEYLNSEKYEIKTRDWDQPGNIKDYSRDSTAMRRAQSARCSRPPICAFCRSTTTTSSASSRNRVDGNNAVAVRDRACPRDAAGILAALRRASRSARPKTSAASRAIENLVTGERRMLEWGGVRLRIDPAARPRPAVPLSGVEAP